MPPTPEKESQAAFARRVGRSKGRITQLKKSGVLGPECFSKDERGRDMVIVAVALEALRANLDPVQVVANGKPIPESDGDLPFDEEGNGGSDVLPRQGVKPATRSSATDELTRLRARDLQMDIEDREKTRRIEAGRYVLAEDVASVFVQTLEQILASFDTALLPLAEQLAAQHGTDINVELVELQKWFAETRTRAAKEQAAMVDRLPRYNEESLEQEVTGDGDSTATCAALGGGPGVAGVDPASAA